MTTTPLLKNALLPLVTRHRRVRSLFASGLCWLLAAAVTFVLIKMHWPKATTFLVAVCVWIVARTIARRWAGEWEPDYRTIARSIEERHPELHAVLQTAVEQQPDPATRQLSYLQQRVISDAVAATRRHQWLDSIPRSRWVAAYATLWIGCAAMFCAIYFTKYPRRTAPKVVATPPSKDALTVTPGDTELERGSGLVILAKFHRDVPSEAVLVLNSKNQPEQRVPLVKNLGDPVFGGGLPEVNADLSYRIEYAGKATRDFAVKVFEHPKLERADATIGYPEYTKLPEKTVPDTRRVSAVEGSKLGVTFNLNKPVKSATLVAKDGTKVPLAVNAEKAVAELKDFALKASQTYELKLEDADGRENKVASQFIVEALPNRPPELKIATPKGDSRVSPIEEVAFRADAWDDFGLQRVGLSYTIGGGEAKDLLLLGETKADEKRPVEHLLKLEELGVKPDELVSWFLWAEDIGPDGQPRRTATDMYFAEVRPFEEIYRQGDSQEGEQQQSSQGNEAQKLAEMQRQIISATWNLQRSEQAARSAQLTPKYLKDEPVIRDSQAEALQKAQALEQKIEDAKSKAFAADAVREMQTALERLKEAEKSAEPLPRALSAEQAASAALLKLAAHEYNVTRNRSRSAGKGGEKNQNQLDELELKEDRKRYETKREATQQNEEQREQLAILNRLKELAQRQNDINERIKELQTALQEAKTEQEKEELQRQLKRLREEEQQMLADVDELKQKMEQSPQQAQLAEERKQLDQTRSEAQKAAEALEKGEASKALASGTRAQRELQQMRDDFRKKTSNQFRDEMREMRADAREIAQRQEQIGERLKEESGKPQRQTLDGSSDREKLAGEFEKQKEQLGQITENMKRVSEQAEVAEPLLAKELYDTLRKTAQAGTSDTLEKTQLLAERGYKPQAQKFEEKARQEIEELKTGVERAAESVLGDEAEALRQARAELDELTKAINREIASKRPDLAQNDPPNPDKNGEQPGAPGEQTGAEPKAGERGEKPGAGEAKTAENSEQTQGAGANRGEPQNREGQQPGERAGQQRGEGQQPGERGEMAQNGERSQNGQPGKDPQAGESGKPGEGQPRGAGQRAEQQAQAGEQPGQTGSQGREGRTAQRDRQGRGEPARGEGEQPGQGQPGSQGQQPGQQGARMAQGQGERGSQGQSGQQGQGQQGQQAQAGEQGQQAGRGEGRGQQAQAGNPPDGEGRGEQAGEGQRGGARTAQAQRAGSRLSDMARGPREASAEGGGRWGGPTDGEQAGPLTGENFVDWQDRLRNVEEMLDSPELRNEVARVREIAKGLRAEFKRHSVEPNWELVNSKVRAPLAEIRDRVIEELARRESKENLVPIDRDPVPTKYAERVRRYYEDLGRSR